MEIAIQIKSYEDRENLILSLVNCGYCVWVKEVPKEEEFLQTNTYVCFNYPKEATHDRE